MLQVNAYGRAKAERFRSHFELSTDSFADKRDIDVHDYLHTVLGARPGDGIDADELRVMTLHDALNATGNISLRGLTTALESPR